MKNYKKILLIPIAIFIISIIVLSVQYGTTGSFIEKDVSLKGGVSATIYTSQEINIDQIEQDFLNQNPGTEISIRELSTFGTKQSNGIIIETDASLEQANFFIEENFPSADTSIQETGEGLGDSFFKEMITAIIFAFILMGIVVFITFRKLIPSLAVIFSALLDIIATLAIINILGVKLSTAGIAAFLMIIGYSIDTDIMLTTKVLKRKAGTLWERTVRAFKTGMTMTLTTMAALFVAFLVTNSIILKQMFGIILIALVIDIISTWFMNTGLLIWYMKKNETDN
jgi:preprotein translocase subunit SecF